MEKKHIKWIAWGLAAVVVLIVILQNTENVETQLLFVSVTMPRALLLLIVGGIGFVMGVVTAVAMGRRKAEKIGRSGGGDVV